MSQFKSLSQASIQSLTFWIAFLLGLVLQGVGWETLVLLSPGNPSGRGTEKTVLMSAWKRWFSTTTRLKVGQQVPTSPPPPQLLLGILVTGRFSLTMFCFWKDERKKHWGQGLENIPREMMVWALSFALEGVLWLWFRINLASWWKKNIKAQKSWDNDHEQKLWPWEAKGEFLALMKKSLVIKISSYQI